MTAERRRALLTAGGAALALVLSAAAGVVLRRALAPVEEAFLCLGTDVGAPDGARCYSPQEIAAFAESPVFDDGGEAVNLRLSLPGDEAHGLEAVRTCEEYEARLREGWRALSSREMRREAFFTRACGVRALLMKAQPAQTSYFASGECSEADIRSLVAGAPFRIGKEAGEDAPADVVRAGAGEWRISAGGQTMLLQEIAHADFNADQRGDMLVYIQIAAEGATAQTGTVGFLDKEAADGPVVFVGSRQ